MKTQKTRAGEVEKAIVSGDLQEGPSTAHSLQSCFYGKFPKRYSIEHYKII